MTYDPSTDLDGASANVAGAERRLAVARERLRLAVDHEAAMATKSDAQPWEAEAARSNAEGWQRAVAQNEAFLQHFRGALDAMAARG